MLSVDEQMRIITSGAAQIVPEADLRKKLEKGEPLNIKLGVDPTSPDLHLGHAVPLRKMRQFQDLGHKVTLIIGNGTALIGDPSGKNSTRPQLSQEQIEANAETYVSQAMKILDPEKTTIVHNGDWILSMDLAGLLQVCSKFTVARILERDDFTKRYQSQTPIALHEFLYPVMQAFDSVQIKADVEMGWHRPALQPARWSRAHGEDGHGAADRGLPCRCSRAPMACARCPSPTATTSA